MKNKIIAFPKFKEEGIERIPKDWKIKQVKVLFDIVTGTTPSTKRREYWEDGTINWITPNDLSKLGEKIKITNSERKITEKALEDSNLTILPKDALILSTRAPVGYIAIIQKEATFNQGCKGLIPKNFNEIHSGFYCYYLLSKKQVLENLSGGSTFKELSKNQLENFKVPFPKYNEQKRIAEVLGTVDEAIEKVNEKIKKTEKLKQGLMQKLLTQGIGHKEFKDTEIGKIPQEWEIVKLGDILDLGNGERPIFNEKGHCPIYGANGIMGYSDKYLVNNDYTIMIGRIGASGEVHLGKGKIWVSDNAIYSKGYKTEKIFMPFLFYLLKSKDLKKFATKSTHPIITQTFLNSFVISIPPLPEQQKIAEILSTVDEKLDLERKRKAKLERIKKGLMNDLLTGKKRILTTDKD